VARPADDGLEKEPPKTPRGPNIPRLQDPAHGFSAPGLGDGVEEAKRLPRCRRTISPAPPSSLDRRIPNDDLAGGWRGLGITLMMWDCYWNGGTPLAANTRFYDDFVVSNRQVVGPVRVGAAPTLVLCRNPDDTKAVEVEVGFVAQRPLERVDGLACGLRTPWDAGTAPEKRTAPKGLLNGDVK
jgi:hypothetical protein